MSELSEARERYRKHLEAKSSPSHEGCPYSREGGTRIGQFWDDQELLARACQGDEHPDTRRLDAIQDRSIIDHISFMGTTVPYWTVHGSRGSFTTADGKMTLRDCIDAAMNNPTADEPVTEEWLRSTFKAVDTAIGPFYSQKIAEHLTFIVSKCDTGWLAELKFTRTVGEKRHTTFVPLREVETRSSVLRLLAALGVGATPKGAAGE